MGLSLQPDSCATNTGVVRRALSFETTFLMVIKRSMEDWGLLAIEEISVTQREWKTSFKWETAEEGEYKCVSFTDVFVAIETQFNTSLKEVKFHVMKHLKEEFYNFVESHNKKVFFVKKERLEF